MLWQFWEFGGTFKTIYLSWPFFCILVTCPFLWRKIMLLCFKCNLFLSSLKKLGSFHLVSVSVYVCIYINHLEKFTRHLEIIWIWTFGPEMCILYAECNYSQHDRKPFSSCNLPVKSPFRDNMKQQPRDSSTSL